MSFTRTWVQQMSVAGLACRDFMMRVSVVLVLSVSILGAMADPFAQFVVATDADDAGKVTFAFTPDLDPEEAIAPQLAERTPDFRYDDLRAARQASSHEWRVASAFEARGPPV